MAEKPNPEVIKQAIADRDHIVKGQQIVKK
jgi:hypothetical protein